MRRPIGLLASIAVASAVAGCEPTLSTPDGHERVRGALWVDHPFGSTDEAALVLIANSPLPCEPAETPDDPQTPEDEAAGAATWWQGQLATAATREGAVILAVLLDAAEDGGQFEIAPSSAELSGDRIGSAWAWRVTEAALSERDGPFFVYEVTEAELTGDLTGSFQAELQSETAAVSFDLAGWTGGGTIDRCQNAVLASYALDLVLQEIGVSDVITN